MRNNQATQAITYILSGTLISLFTSVADGWSSAILSIFGFVWVYVGYQKLTRSSDLKLAEAAKLLQMTAVMGIVASVLDLIPLISVIAKLIFALVFVIEIVGLIKMKGASSINIDGKSGITFILVGIVFSIISSLISFLPFIGDTIASFIAILSITLTFYGWIKVQEGLEAYA